MRAPKTARQESVPPHLPPLTFFLLNIQEKLQNVNLTLKSHPLLFKSLTCLYVCLTYTVLDTATPLWSLEYTKLFSASSMYETLITAETNYHKPNGLKQHKFISHGPVGQKSHMGLKSTRHQECIPFWGLGQCGRGGAESVSLTLKLLEAACIPWLKAHPRSARIASL